MKVLECHSRGDKRFSALYAKVLVHGKLDTIENHYQLSKRVYGEPKPTDWKDLKGKPISFFEVNGRMFPKEYLSDFYNFLWIKYFDRNPKLLQFASQYDDFNDIFKSKNSVNCQADVIRDIVKEGRGFLIEKGKDFLTLLNSKDQDILVIEKDLSCSQQNIIGHQVNCMGVMGAGVALSIRNNYRQAYLDYLNKCQTIEDKTDLLGLCQMVEVDTHKYVANIFGQFTYGRKGTHTQLKYVEEGLNKLKEFAIENNYSISLPYKMGCNLGGEDWDNIKTLIQRVFIDIPIVFYKK